MLVCRPRTPTIVVGWPYFSNLPLTYFPVQWTSRASSRVHNLLSNAILFNSVMSMVQISRTCYVSRGVRQGCPLPPLLYPCAKISAKSLQGRLFFCIKDYQKFLLAYLAYILAYNTIENSINLTQTTRGLKIVS